MAISLQRTTLLAVLGMAALAGCKQKSTTAPSTQRVMTYTVRGVVVSTDAARGEVLLDHEAIPGFMDAMTMPYKLKDGNTISELHPGDKLTARLNVEKDADDVYHGAQLDQVVVVAQAKPDYRPASQYHVPTAGDTVPDLKLINQDGKTVHLAQYKQKALLITFIYTRCPLGDFCPKMSRNFAEIDEALRKDAGLFAKTHLLSISFDPVYDSPAVLKSYGGAYTGKYTKEEFKHWEFVAPEKKDLDAMTHFFNVGLTPGDAKTLNHSLSTVLIAPDGRIAAWYPGNDWKPADVVSKMAEITHPM